MTEEYIQKVYREKVSQIATVDDLEKYNNVQIRNITNDFEEAIIRKIIVNVSNFTEGPFGSSKISVQYQALEIIQKAWRYVHYVDSDNNQDLYDSIYPSYFEIYNLLIASGELITLSTGEEVTLEEEPLPDNNPALWIEAADKVGNVLGNKRSELLDVLSQIQALSSDAMKHLDSLRDGTIKRLRKDLNTTKRRNREIKAELDQLKEKEAAWLAKNDNQRVADLEKTIEQQKSEIEKLKAGMTEKSDDWFKYVTYENVTNYISRHPKYEEDLRSLFEALLPKKMHDALYDDIHAKSRKKQEDPTVRIEVKKGDFVLRKTVGKNIESVNDGGVGFSTNK